MRTSRFDSIALDFFAPDIQTIVNEDDNGVGIVPTCMTHRPSKLCGAAAAGAVCQHLQVRIRLQGAFSSIGGSWGRYCP